MATDASPGMQAVSALGRQPRLITSTGGMIIHLQIFKHFALTITERKALKKEVTQHELRVERKLQSFVALRRSTQASCDVKRAMIVDRSGTTPLPALRHGTRPEGRGGPYLASPQGSLTRSKLRIQPVAGGRHTSAET